jgi:hypothetical protein
VTSWVGLLGGFADGRAWSLLSAISFGSQVIIFQVIIWQYYFSFRSCICHCNILLWI